MWLRSLGLERYEGAFRDSAIDAEVLPDLTEADLEKLGVLLGHRKKLLRAIAELREPLAEREVVTPVAPAHGPTAERRQLTIMFADLVGSTALSGRLDPEEMSGVIRAYQNAVAGEVTRFEGQIAKYLGDGVLAYFGYPKAHEDAAERAVRAGLAVVEALGRVPAPAGGVPLAARVGIATGLVVAGEPIGEGAAREAAVVGETPNLAARLQQLASAGQVVVAESTRALLGAGFDYEELSAQPLKGFDHPVQSTIVLRERSVTTRFEARVGGTVMPMVGRDEELALLMRQWRLARSGEGQAVLVVGEAGIGKSRLIRGLRDAIAGEEHTALLYQCSPFHTDSPLWPITQQLTRAAGFRPEDDEVVRLAKLDALLERAGEVSDRDRALLTHLAGLNTNRRSGLEQAPEQHRAGTLAALVAQLRGLAQASPVLVLFEDVHWLDPTSLELLERVLDQLGSLRVLLVLSSRPDEEPRFADCTRLGRLSLHRLGRESAGLIISRISGKPLPPEVTAPLLARAEGVPLYVEEMTKAVLGTGCLREVADRWVLVRDLPDFAVPQSLQDSLTARLDRLGPAKQVAQVAACFGREFDDELLTAVTELPQSEVEEALNRLVAAELVFRRGLPSGSSYIFKHALLRDAAYGALLKEKRRSLHKRILSVLQQRSRAQPEILAHHAAQAAEYTVAIDHFRQAAAAALVNSALAEAAGHLRSALSLLQHLPPGFDRDRLELTLCGQLGPCLIGVVGGPAEETRAVFGRMRELARAASDRQSSYIAVNGLRNAAMAAGQTIDAIALGQEFLSMARTNNDALEEAVGHVLLVSAFTFAGNLLAARKHFKACLSSYLDANARARAASAYALDPYLWSMDTFAQASWILGHPDRSMWCVQQALAGLESLRHFNTYAHVLAFTGMALIYMRRAEQALGHVHRIRALCDQHGSRFWQAPASWVEGGALIELGEAEQGYEILTDGIERFAGLGGWQFAPVLRCWQARALLALDRYADANAALKTGWDDVARTAQHFADAEIHRMAAQLALAAGERDDAIQALGRGLRVSAEASHRSWQLRCACDLGRLWAEGGERARAHDLLASIYGRFTEGFDTPDLMDAKALLDELR